MSSTLMPPPVGGTGTLKKGKISFAPIAPKKGVRIGIYGAAGIGKTTLAATITGKKVFFDLDDSLPVLKEQLSTEAVGSIATVAVEKWQDMMDALTMDGWTGVTTIIIDTLTKAEEFCSKFTIETVPNDKGRYVKRLDDYGFGKGYAFLYDNFLALLQVLDQHCADGRNVVLIMHDCTTNVPNPTGDDWLRYEPRLSSPASGKGSIRLRVREWLDHLLYIGYETTVKEGKGYSTGRRIITPQEMPFCMAKSRKLANPVEIDGVNNPLNFLIN